MRVLHFDCPAGISGDMALGAFVDLGVDRETLLAALSRLGLPGWTLTFSREERNGITGTRARVTLTNPAGAGEHGHGEHGHDDAHGHGLADSGHSEHGHDGHGHGDAHGHGLADDGHSEHDHGEHGHDDDHGHGHADGGHSEHGHDAHGHGLADGGHSEHGHDGHGHDDDHAHGHGAHPHNSWRDIRALITASDIADGAKQRALDIFTRVAEAEAQVHGTAMDDVAFHEVGALDSIIDIVGAAVCLDLLAPEKVTCGEVELGSGVVHCAHGTLPVPAPATALLTRHMPVHAGGFDKEMTTPTGAAILASCVDEFVTGPASYRETAAGYGLGERRFPSRPNALRVSWRDVPPADASRETEPAPWLTETILVMEAAVDDMTGEALGFLMERLFAAGALDVAFVPCTMKKSRPGVIIKVMARPDAAGPLRDALFRHSTTLGFRETPTRRLALRREERTLPNGAREKTAFLGEEALRSKIEFEDRAAEARRAQVGGAAPHTPRWEAGGLPDPPLGFWGGGNPPPQNPLMVGPGGPRPPGGGGGGGAPAPFACLDAARSTRTGYPEAVYCQGKTVDQAEAIILQMRERGIPVLATRADPRLAERVAKRCAEAAYDELSRVLTVGAWRAPGERTGLVAVVSAGTSDLAAAGEAARTAEFLGSRVRMIPDVGVAGIHRLFERLPEIREARVIVAAAGMEGALASVVAGLAAVPVIALPTSVGYGASFGGLSALLGMLTACAPGVSVVNIDNGYGAGYQANLINQAAAGGLRAPRNCATVPGRERERG